MWLLVPFVVVPIVEIALFIQVGGLIGLWPTIGLVVLSAVVGSWLMRSQGRAVLTDLQQAFRDFRDPTAPLAHGALILLAGALMVTPGFFTDTAGLLLLVPAVRRWVISRLGRRMRVTSAGFGFSGTASGWPPSARESRSVIDAEYVIIEDTGDADTGPDQPGPHHPGPGPLGPDDRPGRRDPRPPSGWTRH